MTSSFKILQESSIQHSSLRFQLKEGLMHAEIRRLKLCLTRVISICNTIKKLNSTFCHLHPHTPQQFLSKCRQLLQPLAAQITGVLGLMRGDNLSYLLQGKNKQWNKRKEQQFFMKMLRGYEGKMAQLQQKIQLMEHSLQYYSASGEVTENEEEEFNEALSSYAFLENYLILQKKKEMAISCLLGRAASRKCINSQIFSTQGITIQDQESMCESILLKEKILRECLKQRISSIKSKQVMEKCVMERLSSAVKQTNARLNRLNLQANINSCNSFLLDKDHYCRHWRTMKQAIDARLAEFVPAVNRLVRSKSCTVMESSVLDEDETSIVFDQQPSIRNEESFLDSLEYFVSEGFIKDLLEHEL